MQQCLYWPEVLRLTSYLPLRRIRWRMLLHILWFIIWIKSCDHMDINHYLDTRILKLMTSTLVVFGILLSYFILFNKYGTMYDTFFHVCVTTWFNSWGFIYMCWGLTQYFGDYGISIKRHMLRAKCHKWVWFWMWVVLLLNVIIHSFI